MWGKLVAVVAVVSGTVYIVYRYVASMAEIKKDNANDEFMNKYGDLFSNQ